MKEARCQLQLPYSATAYTPIRTMVLLKFPRVHTGLLWLLRSIAAKDQQRTGLLVHTLCDEGMFRLCLLL